MRKHLPGRWTAQAPQPLQAAGSDLSASLIKGLVAECSHSQQDTAMQESLLHETGKPCIQAHTCGSVFGVQSQVAHLQVSAGSGCSCSARWREHRLLHRTGH